MPKENLFVSFTAIKCKPKQMMLYTNNAIASLLTLKHFHMTKPGNLIL